ncbi:MAG: CHAT domain-containing protein, partial [Erythrobacter sp.]
VLSPGDGDTGDGDTGDGDAGDGVLTASEIARLDLAADWVLLSACDSAAGFEGGVPAFSGLVAAFRFAGAGSLLATHWKVRDDVAAFVATRTLAAYRRHGDKPRALAQALRALRDESGLPGADRPDIWGPFVLID